MPPNHAYVLHASIAHHVPASHTSTAHHAHHADAIESRDLAVPLCRAITGTATRLGADLQAAHTTDRQELQSWQLASPNR
jgi:hypothetical protein